MANESLPSDTNLRKWDDFGRVFAAIPAKDEADALEGCLAALARQVGAALDGVVLCLNNCSDDSAGVARRAAASLPFAVHILEVALPAARACAGVARRMAMDRAALLAGPRGVVVTTDADSLVAPDWLAVNLAAIRAGADAVAGRAEIEPAGAALIPAHLHAIDARECAYAALLDEIACLIDPDPWDPWPRHDEHSGASIAVTVAAYRRCGGMPPVGLGEDRAFFYALRRVDARIRHAPGARVVVSARLEGRAAGGMADTMRRRLAAVDPYLDDRLEGVAAALRRMRARAELRAAWLSREKGFQDQEKRLGEQCLPPQTPRLYLRSQGDGTSAPTLIASEQMRRLSRLLGVDVAAALDGRCFGAVWAEIEAASAVLARQRVALADLERQTARALRLREFLRGRIIVGDDRGGIDLPDAAD